MRAQAILGGVARVIHHAHGTFDLSGYDNLIDAVVGIITRHPMSEEDLVTTLQRWSPDGVREALADLEASGRAQIVERHGLRFWSAALSHYPGDEASQAADPRKRRPSAAERATG